MVALPALTALDLPLVVLEENVLEEMQEDLALLLMIAMLDSSAMEELVLLNSLLELLALTMQASLFLTKHVLWDTLVFLELALNCSLLPLEELATALFNVLEEPSAMMLS
jgi:hypothetical protein